MKTIDPGTQMTELTHDELVEIDGGCLGYNPRWDPDFDESVVTVPDDPPVPKHPGFEPLWY